VKIAIGSDHAGYDLKEWIKDALAKQDHTVVDVGTFSEGSVDYPDFGLKAAQMVAHGEVEKAILLCGTGIGMSVVANKVKGVRASLVYDLYTALQSRRHLDANILVLGGRVTGKGLAGEIVKTWLATPFEGGRHQERLGKIEAWENSHMDGT
jgi:RpiB/LacA/LacB family sugar-phosphate isomerase